MKAGKAGCMAVLLALLAMVLGGWPAVAAAQGPEKPLPIVTGSTTGRMDAPETNKDLEQYTHSPMVQRVAHGLGLSTAQASRIFEDVNSGVLIAVILYFLFRYVPRRFRAKRETLGRELAEARQMTADAEARLSAIEGRLAAIGKDIDALREQAQAGMEGEEARMHAAVEDERQRIIRSAEAEIEASQASAERGLRAFAANLALERAAARLELSPENDQMLVDEFLQSLAADATLRGQN